MEIFFTFVYILILRRNPPISAIFFNRMIIRITFKIISRIFKTRSHLPSRYASVFRQGMWAATAFKGATSSCALIPTIGTHVANHLAWQGMLKNRRNFVNAYGYVLTGWQRFDHFASLCEFLPVAVPSLRCCLTALKSLKFGLEELELCKSVLGMPNIPMEVYPRPQAIPSDIRSFKFPGADLYVLIQR